jgi:hypothetical protein
MYFKMVCVSVKRVFLTTNKITKIVKNVGINVKVVLDQIFVKAAKD